jgi:hypothetical protein
VGVFVPWQGNYLRKTASLRALLRYFRHEISILKLIPAKMISSNQRDQLAHPVWKSAQNSMPFPNFNEELGSGLLPTRAPRNEYIDKRIQRTIFNHQNSPRGRGVEAQRANRRTSVLP